MQCGLTTMNVTNGKNLLKNGLSSCRPQMFNQYGMEYGWKKTAVQGRQCFTVQSAIEQHTIFSRQETKHGKSGADMHTAPIAGQEC